MRLIDADALAKSLGITDISDCSKCALYGGVHGYCVKGEDFIDACMAIENAPEITLALISDRLLINSMDGIGTRFEFRGKTFEIKEIPNE